MGYIYMWAIYVHLETQSMITVEVFLKCIFRLSAYMIAVAVGVKLSAQGTACRAIYVHLETQSMITVEVFLKCIFRLSAYMIAVAVAVKSSQPKEQPAESSGEIKAAWSGFLQCSKFTMWDFFMWLFQFNGFLMLRNHGSGFRPFVPCSEFTMGLVHPA